MAQRQAQRHAKSHLEAERAIKWREERVSGVIVIVMVSVIVGIGLPSDCHLIYI
jgi:succinate dehydrogenase hydrophobic anchor subunit